MDNSAQEVPLVIPSPQQNPTAVTYSNNSSYLSRLFKGRINRATYWEGGVLILLAAFAIVLPCFLIASLLKSEIVLMAGFVFMFVFTIFIAVSLGVRRLHDVNKSGYLMFLYAGSLPGLLVVIVGFVLGLLGKQTVGGLEQFVNNLNNGFASIPYASLLLGIVQFAANILSLYIAFWAGTKGNNKYGSPLQFLPLKQTVKIVFGLK